MNYLSDNGKLAVSACFQGIESQDDLLPGHTVSDQVIGDAILCRIVLNPEFAVANVNVDDRIVDAAFALPAQVSRR